MARNRNKPKSNKKYSVDEHAGDKLMINNMQMKEIIIVGEECRLRLPESWGRKISIKTLFIYFAAGSFFGASAVLIVALIFYMMGMFVFVNPIN
jgi:hypothetical protein